MSNTRIGRLLDKLESVVPNKWAVKFDRDGSDLELSYQWKMEIVKGSNDNALVRYFPSLLQYELTNKSDEDLSALEHSKVNAINKIKEIFNLSDDTVKKLSNPKTNSKLITLVKSASKLYNSKSSTRDGDSGDNGGLSKLDSACSDIFSILNISKLSTLYKFTEFNNTKGIDEAIIDNYYD